MSSLPGLDLEDFVAWNFDLVVEDQGEANPSLGIAEAIGTRKPRPRLTKDQLAAVLALFEPYRERVEAALSAFDEGNQSWRDYAGYSFDYIPDSVYDAAIAVLRAQTVGGESP